MRKDYIDIAKAVGIFFCILGHICDRHQIMGNINYFITCFNMPLFFIAFGMVAYMNMSPNIGKFIKKRVLGLIVPYFLWAAIYGTKFDIKSILYLIYGTNPAIAQAGSNSMLWFLPTLFIGSVLSYILIYLVNQKQEKKNGIKKIVLLHYCAALVWIFGYIIGKSSNNILLPGALDVAFVSCGFIVYGYILTAYLDNIAELNKKSFLLCGISGGGYTDLLFF